ncbi:unnamed protein product [Ilex paraguariensis]|uniref:F-box domain-containing protein n=1 Tax=Ilex paraguariensis TaxID=185542 RepID=A0ABC8S1K0_9AQUA
MAALIFHSNRNLGVYLSRKRSSFIKSIFGKSRNNSSNTKNQITSSCWHNLPNDIIEKVVKQLIQTDRIRMSSVCKGWRVILTKKDIQTVVEIPWLMLFQYPIGKDIMILTKKDIQTVVEIPWLMLFQYPIGKDISFYNFSEERVYNLELPKSVHGGRCYGCSKGWLIMITGSEFNPSLFLLNAITGAQLRLPSLTTIPSFENFAIWHSKFDSFITGITISSADAAKCIVAAIFDQEILVFYRPGDERWNIFEGDGEEDEIYYKVMLFRNSTLDVLIDGEENHVRNFSIKLSDCEMMLTLISFCYSSYVNVENKIVEFQHFRIFKETGIHHDLAESTNGELLVIIQILDVFALPDDSFDDLVEHEDGDGIGEGHQEYVDGDGIDGDGIGEGHQEYVDGDGIGQWDQEHEDDDDIGEGNQEHEDGVDIGDWYEDEDGCPLRLRYWKITGLKVIQGQSLRWTHRHVKQLW